MTPAEREKLRGLIQQAGEERETINLILTKCSRERMRASDIIYQIQGLDDEDDKSFKYRTRLLKELGFTLGTTSRLKSIIQDQGAGGAVHPTDPAPVKMEPTETEAEVVELPESDEEAQGDSAQADGEARDSRNGSQQPIVAASAKAEVEAGAPAPTPSGSWPEAMSASSQEPTDSNIISEAKETLSRKRKLEIEKSEVEKKRPGKKKREDSQSRGAAGESNDEETSKALEAYQEFEAMEAREKIEALERREAFKAEDTGPRRKRFKCSRCTWEGRRRPDELRRHEEREHPINCSNCPILTKPREAYVRHVRDLHEGWPCKIETCRWVTCQTGDNFRALEASHLRKEHKAPQYRCGECGCRYISKRGLAKHSRQKHRDKHPTPGITHPAAAGQGCDGDNGGTDDDDDDTDADDTDAHDEGNAVMDERHQGEGEQDELRSRAMCSCNEGPGGSTGRSAVAAIPAARGVQLGEIVRRIKAGCAKAAGLTKGKPKRTAEDPRVRIIELERIPGWEPKGENDKCVRANPGQPHIGKREGEAAVITVSKCPACSGMRMPTVTLFGAIPGSRRRGRKVTANLPQVGLPSRFQAKRTQATTGCCNVKRGIRRNQLFYAGCVRETGMGRCSKAGVRAEGLTAPDLPGLRNTVDKAEISRREKVYTEIRKISHKVDRLIKWTLPELYQVHTRNATKGTCRIRPRSRTPKNDLSEDVEPCFSTASVISDVSTHEHQDTQNQQGTASVLVVLATGTALDRQQHFISGHRQVGDPQGTGRGEMTFRLRKGDVHIEDATRLYHGSTTAMDRGDEVERLVVALFLSQGLNLEDHGREEEERRRIKKKEKQTRPAGSSSARAPPGGNPDALAQGGDDATSNNGAGSDAASPSHTTVLLPRPVPGIGNVRTSGAPSERKEADPGPTAPDPGPTAPDPGPTAPPKTLAPRKPWASQQRVEGPPVGRNEAGRTHRESIPRSKVRGNQEVGRQVRCYEDGAHQRHHQRHGQGAPRQGLKGQGANNAREQAGQRGRTDLRDVIRQLGRHEKC